MIKGPESRHGNINALIRAINYYDQAFSLSTPLISCEFWVWIITNVCQDICFLGFFQDFGTGGSITTSYISSHNHALLWLWYIAIENSKQLEEYSGTSDKGHNRNNLWTKDKVQCTKWRLSYSSNIFLTSDKGQPLNKGQNDQKTMGPKRVRFSEVPLYKTS